MVGWRRRASEPGQRTVAAVVSTDLRSVVRRLLMLQQPYRFAPRKVSTLRCRYPPPRSAGIATPEAKQRCGKRERHTLREGHRIRQAGIRRDLGEHAEQTPDRAGQPEERSGRINDIEIGMPRSMRLISSRAKALTASSSCWFSSAKSRMRASTEYFPPE